MVTNLETWLLYCMSTRGNSVLSLHIGTDHTELVEKCLQSAMTPPDKVLTGKNYFFLIIYTVSMLCEQEHITDIHCFFFHIWVQKWKYNSNLLKCSTSSGVS